MENFSLKQLQGKCTELGLKAYGTKATMIERIKTELNKRKTLDLSGLTQKIGQKVVAHVAGI